MIPPLLVRHSRAALQSASDGESARTILVAFIANIVIAVAKLIAGIVSGSAALLGEAAHSFADSLNEVFVEDAHLPMVLTSDGRKLGKRDGALPLPSLDRARVQDTLHRALAFLGYEVQPGAVHEMLDQALGLQSSNKILNGEE